MSIKDKVQGQEISFSDIKEEFGAAKAYKDQRGLSFGKYRVRHYVSQVWPALPLDSGIPQSGEIKFSHFYGKRLNIVLVCGGGNRATPSYNSSVVIGTNNTLLTDPEDPQIQRSLPDKASTSGRRVFMHITGQYTSNGASTSSWALSLPTGFASQTIYSIDQGGGSVYGRGGNGGSASGGNGGNGSNGMRYWSSASNNMSAVYAGGGGGGAGAWAEQNDWGDKNDAQGGGGGGGNGIPGGNGGSGHRSGQAGGATIGGNGGHGRDDGEAKGGQGGNGGSYGGNGQGASGGVNKRDGNGSGGHGGQATGHY